MVTKAHWSLLHLMLTEEFQILGSVQWRWITGAGGGQYGGAAGTISLYIKLILEFNTNVFPKSF